MMIEGLFPNYGGNFQVGGFFFQARRLRASGFGFTGSGFRLRV